MSKFTFGQWKAVQNDRLASKDLLRKVSFQDLVDLLSESRSAVETAYNALIEARQAFIDDCQQKDTAIDQERKSLQQEVSDQEKKIRLYSDRYQKAIGSGAVKEIPDLKKQIAAATAARDEAAATLTALEGVRVTYDLKLFEAAERAVAPFKTAKNDLRVVQREIDDMREIIARIFQFDSDEYRQEIRNVGDNLSIDGYDSLHWSDWSSKMSGDQERA